MGGPGMGQGSRSTVVIGATEVTLLTAWSTALDSIGRLQGSFSYVSENHWNPDVNGGGTWSTSYDVDLRSVVLLPGQ